MLNYHIIVHFFFISVRRIQSSLWALPVLRPDPCKVPEAATGRSGQEKGQGPARDISSLLLYHEITSWREIQTDLVLCAVGLVLPGSPRGGALAGEHRGVVGEGRVVVRAVDPITCNIQNCLTTF